MIAVANDDGALVGIPREEVNDRSRFVRILWPPGAHLGEEAEETPWFKDRPSVDLSPVRADDERVTELAQASERLGGARVQLARVAKETEFGLLEKGKGLLGEAARLEPLVLPAEGRPDEGHDVVPVGRRQAMLLEDLGDRWQEGRLGPIERPVEVEDEEDPRTNPARTLGRPCHAA